MPPGLQIKLVVTKCDGSSPGETKVVVVPHGCSFAELVRCLKSRFLLPKDASAAALPTFSDPSTQQARIAIILG